MYWGRRERVEGEEGEGNEKIRREEMGRRGREEGKGEGEEKGRRREENG